METPKIIALIIHPKLFFYPSENSSYKIYEDDGLSLKYQKGEFAQTLIRCSDTNDSIAVDLFPSEGSFTVKGRNYSLIIHVEKKPVSVTVNGKVINETTEDSISDLWKFNPKKRTLELTFFKKAAEKATISINR